MPTESRLVILHRLLRIFLLIALVGALIVLAGHWDLVHPDTIRGWVRDAGVLGPVVFMLLFAVSAVLFVPGTVMTLAGGALFGPWLGTFYNISGATLGALISFLIARYLARDWAQRRAGRRLRLMMLGVEEEGWKFVLAMRLAGFPYFVLNYMLGLTPVRVIAYTVASFFGMLPALAAGTYAGHVGFQAMGGEEGVLGKIVIAIALVGLAALIPIVVRIVRRKRRAIPVETS